MGKENTPFRGHSGRIDVSVPNALAARAHESLPGRRLGPLPPWLRYVVVGSTASLIYLAIPSNVPLPALVPRLLLYLAVSASAVVALVVGVRRHRPSNPTPWYLLIAGQAIYLVADLTFSTLHDLLHSTAFPSPADLLYLGHYPLVIVAVLQLARSRSRGSDRESLIDGSIIAIGVGVLSLVFLIEPAVAATEQPLLTRSAAAAYPVMDMLVLAVAARLSVGAPLRCTPRCGPCPSATCAPTRGSPAAGWSSSPARRCSRRRRSSCRRSAATSTTRPCWRSPARCCSCW